MTKGETVQLALDLPVAVDSSAKWIFSLPRRERERAYGRMKRLSLLKASRNGFASALARRIASIGDDRTRGLVLVMDAVAAEGQRADSDWNSSKPEVDLLVPSQGTSPTPRDDYLQAPLHREPSSTAVQEGLATQSHVAMELR